MIDDILIPFFPGWLITFITISYLPKKKKKNIYYH